MRRRFLYYLPGLGGCNERMLSSFGLHSRFVAAGGAGLVEHTITGVDEGPAGTGCILALGATPAQYQPQRQTWQDCGRFWIGMENDLPPGPADLVREFGFQGHEIELAENKWRIPLLRRWHAQRCDHVTALPKCIRPVNGKLVETVSPKYQHFDDIAESIWQSFLKQETVSIEVLFKNCAALLAINYRMGAEEVALLGLLDHESGLRLMGLSIDVPVIEMHANAVAQDGILLSEPAIEEESDNG